MAGGTRELTLKLVAETQKMQADIESAGSKISGGFKKGLAVMGGAVAGAFAVDQVISFGKEALDVSSAIAESTSKIQTVFGKAAGGVISFGKNANKSMGLADKDSLEYLGTLGAMYTGLGNSQDGAAGLSKSTMQLAADLGSFNNVSTPETLDMMSSAFRGEYDSLQRMLPGMTAAAVETEALAATHKTSAKDLTANEKALATLSLMYKQAGPAIGDFARTSQGAANQQKIMEANMSDMKATVGNVLLPAFNAVLKFINEMLFPGMKWFFGWVKDVGIPWMIDAWAKLWVYIGPVITMLIAYVKSLWDFLWSFVKFFVDVFTGNWQGAWNDILGMFKAAWAFIKAYVDLIWHYIQMVWNVILWVFKNIGPLILDAILLPYKLAWSFIQWIAGVIWHGIQAAWDGMLGALRATGSALYEAMTWPFRAAWDFIKRTWNNTLGKVNFTVPGWIPGIGGKEFKMPQLAAGGIVTRPMMALVGEGGPEAVIPLRKAGGLGSGKVYNINVSAGVGDPYAIGQQVVSALQAYERVAGPRPSGTRGSGQAA